MTARILFHVQHLLGIGHLRRAVILARHFAAAGYDTVLTSGGLPVPGLDLGGAQLVQLPPVRATDRFFKVLADADGALIDDAFRQRRTAMLLDTLHQHRPDLLITELFPFGRRQLRFELVPLVEAARALKPRPLIVSSVRDILVKSPKPERVDEMIDLFGRYYDFTMIHGDPAFIPFARTFPRWREIEDRTFHTGYVIDGLPAADAGTGLGRNEVVVSAGGGAVGAPLLHAALAARPLCRLRDRRWRLLCG
ncbi:MAG TPA: glycosyl transferase, partial [Vineibacter sp.]|nr:glycosyl transferase [Vineibacter sp.]